MSISLSLNLASIPRRVREATGASVPYRLVWEAAVAGDFPASKAGGRWVVQEKDLPAIIAALGMSDISAAGVLPPDSK